LMVCCATYVTHGFPFPELVPYQTFQFLPSIVVLATDAPIGWLAVGFSYQTIRKPPLGAEALGSPPAPVLNQTS
jgi:hypothetical protein